MAISELCEGKTRQALGLVLQLGVWPEETSCLGGIAHLLPPAGNVAQKTPSLTAAAQLVRFGGESDRGSLIRGQHSFVGSLWWAAHDLGRNT